MICPHRVSVAYRPRAYGNNPLYLLLQDHWESFKWSYDDRFQQAYGALRPIIERVVFRYLDCGNPSNGFARIRCPDCGKERLLAFSCKCRGFCPSCQSRRAEEWALWLSEHLLRPVPHHHLVFTLPKLLRAYFRYDRSLFSALGRAAHRAIRIYLQSFYDTSLTPGLVIVRQSFGEGARFHPHLHVLAAGGGWDPEGGWRPVMGWDVPTVRALFEAEVFQFLRARELITADRIALIRSWRHSGFGFYAGEALDPADTRTTQHVARYLLRPVIAYARMQYLREEGKVLFYREQQGRGEPVEVDAVECVARLVAHIPDHQERQVTYSGVYASASRHRRMRSPKDTEAEPGGIPEPEPESRYQRRMRMRWARLIRQVWLDDPLLCPRCAGQMAILSFITDPGVVRRILRHLREKQPREQGRGQRAPPELVPTS